MDRPSPERGEEHKWHTDGDWCRGKTTDCSLMAADADIFIQLAKLTVIKENETLRLVCRGRRRKKKKTKRRDQRVSSVTFSDQQASSFLVTNRRKEITLKRTLCNHTHFLVNRHAHKYLCCTEASFPALLYLMHIKYHFPEKIPQCLVFVGHREILS